MRTFLCLLTIVAIVAFSGCLEKDITSGPDRPDALDGSGEADGSFDLVLPAPGTEPSTYDVTIVWGWEEDDPYPQGTPIVICDTVPVEWQVVQVITFSSTVHEVVDGFLEDAPDGLGGTGTINVFPANKKNGGDDNKSATKIEYTPDVDFVGYGYINVVVTTRERPQGDGRDATIEWTPIFCGRLYLNHGAIGYEIDENGDLVLDAELNPVVLEEQTDPLFVVAVFDVDGNGIIVRDGSGDEDDDGVVDGEDNCPCVDNPDQVDTDLDGEGDACCYGALDGDGVDDYEDNCPLAANANQHDWDNDGIGDVCDDDLDGDGVLNENDSCQFTPVGDVVDPANGGSIDQLVPCEGPFGTTTEWKNHGQYVRSVTHTAKSFFEQGLITEANRGAIVSGAASSDCGDK
jgi:hypothetical protein